MQLPDQAIEAYSKLTLADCARVDCALIIRTVSYLHNAALNEPGGVPEEFDAIHEAFNSLNHSERNQAFRKGQEEAEERKKARESRSQAAYQISQASKIQNAINNKPLKKLAAQWTLADSKEAQHNIIYTWIEEGKTSFSSEQIDALVRRQITMFGEAVINPVDREMVSSNQERWKQTNATARQQLKSDGLIFWAARVQRWQIILTKADVQKERKIRVEDAPVRILQIKRTGT